MVNTVNALPEGIAELVPVTAFTKTEMWSRDSGLYSHENLHGTVVSMAVDALSRTELGVEPEKAFSVPLFGADYVDESEYAAFLLRGVASVQDDTTIISACKLAGYGLIEHCPIHWFESVDTQEPDSMTIYNIRVLVERVVRFFEHVPVLSSDVPFTGAYTEKMDSGSADFVTCDTLWDLKVLRRPITPKHSLKLLASHVLAKESSRSEFSSVTRIGIMNPRLNVYYLLDTRTMPRYVVDTIKRDVIGYPL